MQQAARDSFVTVYNEMRIDSFRGMMQQDIHCEIENGWLTHTESLAEVSKLVTK